MRAEILTALRQASCTSLALASALAFVVVAQAHHSQQPFFHMDQDIEITGSVVSFDFVNPHPMITLTIRDADGTPIEWRVEGPTAIYLSRTGWTAESIRPGETITVRGAPPKKVGARTLAGREVRKADGTVLRLYADDARRVLELDEASRR